MTKSLEAALGCRGGVGVVGERERERESDCVGGAVFTVTINPNVRTNATETLTNAPASSVASWNIHALVRHDERDKRFGSHASRRPSPRPIASFTCSRRRRSRYQRRDGALFGSPLAERGVSVKDEAHTSRTPLSPV